MSAVQMTDHALVRLAQRGVAPSDIELILGIGTEVEDGFMVRAQDRQEIERSVKGLLSRLRRLEGKRVVMAGDRVVTAYHTNRRKQRRLLRAKREAGQ